MFEQSSPMSLLKFSALLKVSTKITSISLSVMKLRQVDILKLPFASLTAAKIIPASRSDLIYMSFAPDLSFI